MLAVEKELLQATTAREVAALRNNELQYYLDHIGSIQTVATLLAGFAFTAFLSMEGPGFSIEEVRFQAKSGAYDGSVNENGTLSIIPVVKAWRDEDWTYFVAFGFSVSQSLSVCMCLCEMLHVLIETLIARLLGSRLAL